MAALMVFTDRAGRLTVRSGGRRPRLTLTFTSRGLTIAGPGAAPMTLAWDRCRAPAVAAGDRFTASHAPLAAERAQGWSLSVWLAGRNGPAGVAVAVWGDQHTEDAARALRRGCTSWWERAIATVESPDGGVLIPVQLWQWSGLRSVFGTLRATTTPVVGTLQALCSLLHDRADLRQRLDEPARALRLGVDLAGGMLPSVPPAGGIGRDAVDIHVALREAGFVHRYGRPLQPSALPSLDDVVDTVVERLHANPYRGDRSVDVAQVTAIARRDYLDVEPWPFAALVSDDLDR